MAKVKNGSLLSSVSGTVGDIIYRTRNGKTHAYPKPPKKEKKPNDQLTEAEKKKQTHFSNAVKYAQSVIRDPKQKAAWKKTLRRGKSVYHAAIRQYLKNNMQHPDRLILENSDAPNSPLQSSL